MNIYQYFMFLLVSQWKSSNFQLMSGVKGLEKILYCYFWVLRWVGTLVVYYARNAPSIFWFLTFKFFNNIITLTGKMFTFYKIKLYFISLNNLLKVFYVVPGHYACPSCFITITDLLPLIEVSSDKLSVPL